MVKLEIHIVEDKALKEQVFRASVENSDEIIAGYGCNPYEALRDLINELEYQHEYFRPD